MIIRDEIKIDFSLSKQTIRCIAELEEVYRKAQLIEDKTSEEYDNLEGEFYGLTLELEIHVMASWRSGRYTEEQGDLLLYKYEPF